MRFQQIKVLMAFLLLLVTLLTPPLVAMGQQTFPPTLATVDSDVDFKAGEVIVRFNDGLSRSAMASIQKQYDAQWQHNLYHSETQVWQVPEGKEVTAVVALNTDPNVRYAELNYRYHAFETIPNDPSFNQQWAYTNVQAPEAWDYETGDGSIIIAILDSGIDPNHPDLKDKLVPGRNLTPVVANNDTTDENGHGTHVAGIAAASSNNTIGVAGMSWGAKIMPVKVLDEKGDGWNLDIANGIRWAYQNGAQIINLSLGGTSFSQAMYDAVQEAHAAGSLVIAAMGNCRTAGSGCSEANPDNYPAKYNDVVGVAATARDNTYTYYSQYGAHCDIAAPGGEMRRYGDPNGIYSTMPTYAVDLTTSYEYLNDYDQLQGTSQAAPYVSGLAALIWSLAPTLSADQVWAQIRDTATDLGPTGKDADYGYGLINAKDAVQSLAAPLPPELYAIVNVDKDGDYIVDWNSSEIADTYTLEESPDVAFASPVVRYSGSATQFTVSAQSTGFWYYRVRASNPKGDSAWSATQSVGVAPSAPTTVTLTNAGAADAYQITWPAVDGADGYRLQQDSTSTFSTNPTLRYVGANTSYDVTGQPGGTWYYRVLAYNLAGDGAWSTTQFTQVAPSLLPAPEWRKDTIHIYEQGDFYLGWHAVVSATSYTLEESNSPYFVAPVEIYTGPTTLYTATNHAFGLWYYRVRAHNTEGNSPWSETESVSIFNYVYLPLITRN